MAADAQDPMAARPPHLCAADKAIITLTSKGFVRMGDPSSEPMIFWHPDTARVHRFILLTSSSNQAIVAIPVDVEQL